MKKLSDRDERIFLTVAILGMPIGFIWPAMGFSMIFVATGILIFNILWAE